MKPILWAYISIFLVPSADASRASILDDVVIKSIKQGVVSQFACTGQGIENDEAVKVYALSPAEREDGSIRQEFITEFRCTKGPAIYVQMRSMSPWNQPFSVNRFGSLTDVHFRFEDLDRLFKYWPDLIPYRPFGEVFDSNQIAQQMAASIKSVSAGDCRWKDRRLRSPDKRPVIRDETGIPSYEFQAQFGCTNSPDPSCNRSYSFWGVFYPSRAYVLIRSIEYRVTCT